MPADVLLTACMLTLMAKQELESGISRDVVERTSSSKKQNRDILGMGFCKKARQRREKSEEGGRGKSCIVIIEVFLSSLN